MDNIEEMGKKSEENLLDMRGVMANYSCEINVLAFLEISLVSQVLINTSPKDVINAYSFLIF